MISVVSYSLVRLTESKVVCSNLWLHVLRLAQMRPILQYAVQYSSTHMRGCTWHVRETSPTYFPPIYNIPVTATHLGIQREDESLELDGCPTGARNLPLRATGDRVQAAEHRAVLCRRVSTSPLIHVERCKTLSFTLCMPTFPLIAWATEIWVVMGIQPF